MTESGHRADRADAVEIRPARAADAEAVADVYLASFRGTYDFPLAHSDDQVRTWICDVLIPAGDTWVATARAASSDRVVAMLVVRADDLDQLYVHPDWQGAGIGRRLIELAKAQSPAGLGLYTFQVNARARRFYERNGFVADRFGDGSGNEEGQPDVHYEWRPTPGPLTASGDT